MTQGMLDGHAPSGVKWLSHPKALATYVALLGSSQKDPTLEACAGALQNLTASKKMASIREKNNTIIKLRGSKRIVDTGLSQTDL